MRRIFVLFWYLCDVIFAVFFRNVLPPIVGFPSVPHFQCPQKTTKKRSFPEKPTCLNPLIHGQGPITGHIETSGPTAPPSRWPKDSRTRDSGIPTTDLFMQSIDICSLGKFHPKVNLEEGSQLKGNLPVYKIWCIYIYRHTTYMYIYIYSHVHTQTAVC